MMSVYRFEAWGFVGTLALAASFAGSSAAVEGGPNKTGPVLRVDPLLVAYAGEVWSVIARADNPVWTGWNASDTPLLFYLPGAQDVLINHPQPPKGFRRYSGPVAFPRAAVHVRDGPTFFEFDGQNTVLDVAGVPTLVVADTLSTRRAQLRSWLADPRPASAKAAEIGWDQLQVDPYDTLCLIAHEAFHAFQRRQAPGKVVSEAALARYPALAVANTVGFALEGNLLADALRSRSAKELRAPAVGWLAVRRERHKALPAEAVAYEDGIEYLEGLAKYVEYRLLQVLEGRTPGPALAWAQGFRGYADLGRQREALVRRLAQNMRGEVNVNNDPYGASPVRMRLYYSGMAVAAVLDRLSPGWKKKVFARGATLTGLAADALRPTDGELEAALRAARARPGYAALVRSKAWLQRDGDAATAKLVREIERGPHTALVIDYAALAKEKVGLAFTPFGILRVDDDRTIYRLVPITARVGGLTLRQTAAVPLLHERAAHRLVFQLGKRLPADKARALFGVGGDAAADFGKVALPGAGIEGGRGTVSVRDGKIVLRLVPRE
jgi:hypothetical protein